MTDWQPIETAPKNGESVILAQGRFVEVGFWVDTSHQEQQLVSSSGRRETYEWVDVVSGYWEGTTEIYGPTHWMPLPEPPK